MTIDVLDTKEVLTGDGTTTVFPFDFKVDVPEDIRVFLTSIDGVETELEQGEDAEEGDYFVTLHENQNSNPGGTVTMAWPPGVGVPLVTMRGVDFIRSAEFTEGVPPHVIESELDRLTMYAQQLGERLDRCLHVSAATQELTDLNYRNALTRRDSLVGFDDQGAAALYKFEDGSIVGPMGPVKGAHVEYGAPAILVQLPDGTWSHNSVEVTFVWAVNGGAVETRSVTVVRSGSTLTIPEPNPDIEAVFASGGAVLRLTSEFDGVGEYAQLMAAAMPSYSFSSDDFTPSWNAADWPLFSPPAGTVDYTIRAGLVALSVSGERTANSDSDSMTWEAGSLPEGIRPTGARTAACTLVSGGTEVAGYVTLNADGSAAFSVLAAHSAQPDADGFSPIAEKGLPAHWNVVYQI